MLRPLVALGLLAAAACGGDLSGGNHDGGDDDAPQGCSVSLAFDPAQPIAGQSVRAIAVVGNAPGVLGYLWTVSHDGSQLETTPAQPDNSEVTFSTTDAGVYAVTLQVQANTFCPTAQQDLNVRAQGANNGTFRLHVAPAPSANIPPYERTFQVPGGGGAWDLGAVALDPGITSTVQVTGPSGGVPAYLRFAPSGTPDAAVEAFADTSGFATVQLQGVGQTVLVVPSVPGVAPKQFTNWQPGSTTLALDAGTTLSGTVRDPSGTGISGAAVQLFIDGVPSTLTTSGSDGSFSVLASVAPGASVTVDVTPPSFLPRLQATAVFPLATATPIAIRYASNLGVRSVSNTVVKRAGIALPGAHVAFVASLAAVGNVTVGATTATATGLVHLAETADDQGALSGFSAPAAPLSAIVTATPGDLTVAAFDLTSSVPATIDAPAPQIVSLVVRDPLAVNALANVAVDLEPAGALALANAPGLQGTTGSGGGISLAFAAGGHYDLRFSDPAGRGAPLVVSDVTATTAASAYALLPAILLSGTVQLSSAPSAIDGSSVQVLCADCTGVERSRPIAATATDATGAFSLAIPDPGTNM